METIASAFFIETRAIHFYSGNIVALKRLTAIFVSLVALAGTAWAGDAIPFSVGEKLTYQIFWGPFVVGRATLEVAGIEPFDGHNCYYLVAKAKTSGLVDLLFPVDSIAESWLDCDGLFTRQYREDRTEGKHHRSNETHFDYAHKETVITDRLDGKVQRMALNEPVQDVVSSLYVMRTRKLMLDSDQTFMINAGTTNYNVTIRPDQRKSVWVHPIGDVMALRVEPTPTLNIVSANKGHMWFWVSDDERRLPLLVNSDLKFGTAKLVLLSISTGKTPPTTTAKPVAPADPSPLASNDVSPASEH
jgi:uncharacterized protein DUF3108